MVTIDEIVFKTPDKLHSGEAITEVIRRCVPSVKRPMRLLAKDIDFIMVCLRKLTYGETMDIGYTHSCENASKHSYSIPMTPFLRGSKRIDPTTISSSFMVTLENGQVVKIEPPRFDSVLNIYRAASNANIELGESQNDYDIMRADLTETFVSMIQSVDDISERKLISEWIQQIPAGWMHTISDQIESVADWGPNFNTTVTCKDCGEETSVSTPINPLAFFI